MKVLEVFNSSRVLLDLEVSSRDAVIKELAELLYAQKVITDVKMYVDSVLEREVHSTTGVGNGIAIPHGKSACVNRPAIVFAKMAKSVEWQSLDDKPVDIVVMLAIPDSEKGATHLSLLSEIAVKLMDEDLVEKLKKSYGYKRSCRITFIKKIRRNHDEKKNYCCNSLRNGDCTHVYGGTSTKERSTKKRAI